MKAIALHTLLGWRKATARRNIQDSPLAAVVNALGIELEADRVPMMKPVA